jgi:hypothetical protein
VADDIKKRLENPTPPFLLETAELQLERAGVTLSSEWTRHPSTDPESPRTTREPHRIGSLEVDGV